MQHEIIDDDEDIDYSDIPELDEEFWKDAIFVAGYETKDLLTMKLDRETIAWFKQPGNSYKGKINEILKSYIENESKQSIETTLNSHEQETKYAT